MVTGLQEYRLVWLQKPNSGRPLLTIDANIPPTMANGNRLPIIDKTSPTQSRTELQAPRIRIINTNGSVVLMVSTNNSELQIKVTGEIVALYPRNRNGNLNGATVNQVQNRKTLALKPTNLLINYQTIRGVLREFAWWINLTNCFKLCELTKRWYPYDSRSVVQAESRQILLEEQASYSSINTKKQL
jgi:hypothetical protein